MQQEAHQTEDVDLREYIAVVRKQKWFIGIVAFIIVMMANKLDGIFQHRHHADDDGEERRAFDHGRGDDHRRRDLAGRRRLPALLRAARERAAPRLRDYLLRRGYPPGMVMRTVATLTGARPDGDLPAD